MKGDRFIKMEWKHGEPSPRLFESLGSCMPGTVTCEILAPMDDKGEAQAHNCQIVPHSSNGSPGEPFYRTFSDLKRVELEKIQAGISHMEKLRRAVEALPEPQCPAEP